MELGMEVAETPELDAGAVETPELDQPDAVETPEPGAETPQEGEDEASGAYTTRFSREMRAALKAWGEQNPEMAKFAKQARETHARMFALSQLEPKGIEGVREKYALLDGLIHGDAKGPDALIAIQEQVRQSQETDELLASGDPRVLESLGENFNEGLAKLAPAILDRVAKSDPEAYQAAITPHLVQTLANSPFIKEFNALIDVLSAQNDPRFDEKTKATFTVQQMGKMAEWLNGLASSKQPPPTNKPGQQPQQDQERTKFEQEKQKFHWDTKIVPQVAQHEKAKFDELLNPYMRRLKLDDTAKDGLLRDFRQKLTAAAKADKTYMGQLKIYQGQKSPDPATVANFVKNAASRLSKPVMDALIKERYGAFLAGPQKAAPVAPKPAQQNPAGPKVVTVGVKPPMHEIDHQNTPLEWIAQRQYRMMDGRVVKVVKQ